MTIEKNKITADEGKIFALKSTGEVVANQLWLGVNDSADNYVEVDEPEDVEQEKIE